MTISGLKVRRRLFVAVGLLVIGTGAWFYWSQWRRQTPPPLAHAPEPFVKLASDSAGSADRALVERAEYFDPTPLFVPTERNYGQGPLPGRVVRQPGQVFGDFEPKLTFNENNLASFAAESVTQVDNLPEVLDRGNEAPFAGFGQTQQAGAALSEREGFIEVKALNSGMLVISGKMEGARLSQRDFAPVEFLALVSNAGFVADPVVTTGSGSDEVDRTITEYLVKTYRLGERLAPGQYVVSVGP